jgi:hypothetical protein
MELGQMRQLAARFLDDLGGAGNDYAEAVRGTVRKDHPDMADEDVDLRVSMIIASTLVGSPLAYLAMEEEGFFIPHRQKMLRIWSGSTMALIRHAKTDRDKALRRAELKVFQALLAVKVLQDEPS